MKSIYYILGSFFGIMALMLGVIASCVPGILAMIFLGLSEKNKTCGFRKTRGDGKPSEYY